MAFAAAYYEPQREPAAYGDLSLLARQALMPQEERIRSVLAIRDQLLGPLRSQLEEGQLPTRRRMEAGQFRDDLRRADLGPVRENPRYAEADVLRAQYRQEARDTAALLPHAHISAAERRGAGELQEVLAEVRALRADVARLSRAMSPAGQELDFHLTPVLADPVSGRQLEIFPSRQEDSRQQMELSLRRQEAARVGMRQQDLLRALRRATARLESVPRDSVPAGLYDGVIGEIYRARHSIAMFGGTQGAAQLAGQNFSVLS